MINTSKPITRPYSHYVRSYMRYYVHNRPKSGNTFAESENLRITLMTLESYTKKEKSRILESYTVGRATNYVLVNRFEEDWARNRGLI